MIVYKNIQGNIIEIITALLLCNFQQDSHRAYQYNWLVIDKLEGPLYWLEDWILNRLKGRY